jgi:hypothetical protein
VLASVARDWLKAALERVRTEWAQRAHPLRDVRRLGGRGRCSVRRALWDGLRCRSTVGESADGRSMVYLGVGAYFHFNDLAAQTLSQERVLKWCCRRAPAYDAHALRKRPLPKD